MSKIYPDIDNFKDFTEKVCYGIKDNKLVNSGVKYVSTKDPLKCTDANRNGISKCQIWVLTGLFITFTAGCFGSVIMWLTNTFDNAIFANLVIKEHSPTFDMWQNPSPRPIVKFFLFNYTNIEDFESGTAEKLHVEEVGPYSYEEALERVNVKFDGRFLTYQEKRSYTFLSRSASRRKQSDKVIVPNIPLFGAAALGKNSNFLTRLGISSLLSSMDAKPFLNIPAHRIIMGYEDNLYSLAKNVLRMQNQNPQERIGLLASKSGIQPDVFVIDTGAENINDIDKIMLFNGKESLKHWSTDECNSIEGATDGTMYSPKLVRNKRDLKFFIKEFCRPLPLVYEKETTILNGRIPAYKYKLPYTVFDSPDRNPENQCYCNMETGVCPPQGVFNTTPCTFGVPTFISFPHFYNGDPKLLEAITGLNPKPKIHETFVNVHPTMGFSMSGKTRFQINVQVQKSFGISQVEMFEDEIFLPVAWVEVSLEDKTLPDDMVSIIFQTTYTIRSIELILKYGSLISVIITSLSTIIILKAGLRKRLCQFFTCYQYSRHKDQEMIEERI